MGGPFPTTAAAGAGSGFLAALNPWLGAISAIGSIFGRRKRDRSSAQFHQRMQDMESYGIHPLAAIGGSGMSGVGQGAIQTNDMMGGLPRGLASRLKKEAMEEKTRLETREDANREDWQRHYKAMAEAPKRKTGNGDDNFFKGDKGSVPGNTIDILRDLTTVDDEIADWWRKADFSDFKPPKVKHFTDSRRTPLG